MNYLLKVNPFVFEAKIACDERHTASNIDFNTYLAYILAERNTRI